MRIKTQLMAKLERLLIKKEYKKVLKLVTAELECKCGSRKGLVRYLGKIKVCWNCYQHWYWNKRREEGTMDKILERQRIYSREYRRKRKKKKGE